MHVIPVLQQVDFLKRHTSQANTQNVNNMIYINDF
jgi:hypothetical protein